MNRNNLLLILLAGAVFVAAVFHLSTHKTQEEGIGKSSTRKALLSAATRDAAARMGLSRGKSGILDCHPSLRIALFEWLGPIHQARTGAVDAKILATATHPNE